MIELEKLQLPSLGHSRPNKDPDDRPGGTSSTPATAVPDFENLKVHSLDTDLIPVTESKPWTYVEEARSHSQVGFDYVKPTDEKIVKN